MTIATVEVEAKDLLSELNREHVFDYLAEDKTVTVICTELLAFQLRTPAITIGTIEPTVTRGISVPYETILQALMKLRDTVGGYIEVDNNRQLNWYLSIGEDKGQQLRYGKNLKGIEREIDYTRLYNRIYAYGAGEGDARIKLSDNEGIEEDYIEDTDSQTKWDGVYIKAFVDKSITHPETLLAWAEQLLEEHKDPPISYAVESIDLAQDFEFEKLQLGSMIRIIDEDLKIDIETKVTRIEHSSLDKNPYQMTVELSTRMRDITDTLGEVYDRQQFDQHIATNIGAGQVVVKGMFTVSDWVSAGETTIDGANITTGTIIADAIGAGTITGKTIIISGVDGILKSSNYAADSAGWQIKGNGNAEFNEVKVRGSIYTSSIIAGNTLTVNGTISAGEGKVILSSAGAQIIDSMLKFYYDNTGNQRGYFQPADLCLYLYGFPNFTINAGAGDLNLFAYKDLWVDGDDFTLISCREGSLPVFSWGGMYPSSYYDALGSSSDKWYSIYVRTVYEGSPKLTPKINYLDEIMGIKLMDDGSLDKLSLPGYLVEKNPLADLSDEKFRLKQEEQSEQMRRFAKTYRNHKGKLIKMKAPERCLSREHSVAIGGLALLAIEGVKALTDKVEALEKQLYQ